MTDHALIEAEVHKNFEAFQKLLPALIVESYEKYAVMHDQKLVDILDTYADAIKLGYRLYPDLVFSVQHIVRDPIFVGFHSTAHGPSVPAAAGGRKAPASLNA